MSVKMYPATFKSFILTLGVKSGGRRKVRNVRFGIKHADPLTKGLEVVEAIKTLTYGKPVSLRMSLGRSIFDESGAMGQEPDEPIKGLAVIQSPDNLKTKNFLNIPWVKTTVTLTDLQTLALGHPFAGVVATPTIVAGVANPDEFLLTYDIRWKSLGQMTAEGEVDEMGDTEGDEAAEGVL